MLLHAAFFLLCRFHLKSCVLLFLLLAGAAYAQNVSVNFPVFNSSTFACSGVPVVLGLTYCVFNNSLSYMTFLPTQFSALYSQQGARLMYRNPITFYSGGMVASFHTFIIFSIAYDPAHPQPALLGSGITFLIAPAMDTPASSDGSGFGLFPYDPATGACLNGVDSKVLAVEFDTYISPGIDTLAAPHVGLDINSLVSVNSTLVSTSYLGSPNGLWIDYNATTLTLSVFLAPVSYPGSYLDGTSTSSKPTDPVLTYSDFQLSKFIQKTSYIGLSAGTNPGAWENSQIMYWSFTSFGITTKTTQPSWYQYLWSDSSKSTKVALIAGSVVGSVMGSYLLAELLFFLFFKRIKNPQTPSEVRWPVRRRTTWPRKWLGFLSNAKRPGPQPRKVRDSLSIATPLHFWNTPVEPDPPDPEIAEPETTLVADTQLQPISEVDADLDGLLGPVSADGLQDVTRNNRLNPLYQNEAEQLLEKGKSPVGTDVPAGVPGSSGSGSSSTVPEKLLVDSSLLQKEELKDIQAGSPSTSVAPDRKPSKFKESTPSPTAVDVARGSSDLTSLSPAEESSILDNALFDSSPLPEEELKDIQSGSPSTSTSVALDRKPSKLKEPTQSPITIDQAGGSNDVKSLSPAEESSIPESALVDSLASPKEELESNQAGSPTTGVAPDRKPSKLKEITLSPTAIDEADGSNDLKSLSPAEESSIPETALVDSSALPKEELEGNQAGSPTTGEAPDRKPSKLKEITLSPTAIDEAGGSNDLKSSSPAEESSILWPESSVKVGDHDVFADGSILGQEETPLPSESWTSEELETPPLEALEDAEEELPVQSNAGPSPQVAQETVTSLAQPEKASAIPGQAEKMHSEKKVKENSQAASKVPSQVEKEGLPLAERRSFLAGMPVEKSPEQGDLKRPSQLERRRSSAPEKGPWPLLPERRASQQGLMQTPPPQESGQAEKRSSQLESLKASPPPQTGPPPSPPQQGPSAAQVPQTPLQGEGQTPSPPKQGRDSSPQVPLQADNRPLQQRRQTPSPPQQRNSYASLQAPVEAEKRLSEQKRQTMLSPLSSPQQGRPSQRVLLQADKRPSQQQRQTPSPPQKGPQSSQQVPPQADKGPWQQQRQSPSPPQQGQQSTLQAPLHGDFKRPSEQEGQKISPPQQGLSSPQIPPQAGKKPSQQQRQTQSPPPKGPQSSQKIPPQEDKRPWQQQRQTPSPPQQGQQSSQQIPVQADKRLSQQQRQTPSPPQQGQRASLQAPVQGEFKRPSQQQRQTPSLPEQGQQSSLQVPPQAEKSPSQQQRQTPSPPQQGRRSSLQIPLQAEKRLSQQQRQTPSPPQAEKRLSLQERQTPSPQQGRRSSLQIPLQGDKGPSQQQRQTPSPPQQGGPLLQVPLQTEKRPSQQQRQTPSPPQQGQRATLQAPVQGFKRPSQQLRQTPSPPEQGRRSSLQVPPQAEKGPSQQQRQTPSPPQAENRPLQQQRQTPSPPQQSRRSSLQIPLQADKRPLQQQRQTPSPPQQGGPPLQVPLQTEKRPSQQPRQTPSLPQEGRPSLQAPVQAAEKRPSQQQRQTPSPPQEGRPPLQVPEQPNKSLPKQERQTPSPPQQVRPSPQVPEAEKRASRQQRLTLVPPPPRQGLSQTQPEKTPPRPQRLTLVPPLLQEGLLQSRAEKRPSRQQRLTLVLSPLQEGQSQNQVILSVNEKRTPRQQRLTLVLSPGQQTPSQSQAEMIPLRPPRLTRVPSPLQQGPSQSQGEIVPFRPARLTQVPSTLQQGPSQSQAEVKRPSRQERKTPSPDQQRESKIGSFQGESSKSKPPTGRRLASRPPSFNSPLSPPSFNSAFKDATSGTDPAAKRDDS